MRVELDNTQERASAKEAVELLLRDGVFLADTWNQDLWIALAAEAFSVPLHVAQDALKIDTRGKNRVKTVMKLLQEESSRHPWFQR